MTALRVLHVVGGYPTPERPHNQVFLQTQIDSLTAAGIRCAVLNLSGRRLGKYVTGWEQVRRALARDTYDLLHAHYAYCGAISLAHGLPVVTSLLGSDLTGAAGADGHHSDLARRCHLALARFVARSSAACIVKSPRMGAELGLEVHVVPNGVDISRFQPLAPQLRAELRSSLGLATETRYALFAGDPQRRLKRYPLARAAVDAAAARVPFPLELLTLCGQSHAEVIRYMQACDLLVLTSTSEGSPNVVKEAMAAGLAVVSVDVGDTRERLGGVAGCRVTDVDDPVTIGTAIAEVLTSGEPREGPRAVASLSLEAVAAQVIRIYESAVESRRPQPTGLAAGKASR
jgi:teichuronic acid biosynthesis glycosyltransferase TuaC